MNEWPKCNARKRGWADRVEKLEPGEHGGDGYCGRSAGHGLLQKDASLTDVERRSMRCSRHGTGVLTSGLAHPSFVNGSRSRHAIELAPARVKRRLEEMIAEHPHLLSRQTEIAMLITRVYDCWGKVGDGTPDPRILAIMAEQALVHLQSNEPVDAKVQLEKLIEKCQAGVESEVWWKRMMEGMGLLTKMQRDEKDFQLDVGRFVKLERMQVAAQQLVEFVREGVMQFVTDPAEQENVLDYVAGKLDAVAESHSGT